MNYPANKLYFPKFGWNGLLIVGDVPYDEKSVAAPFMQSHLGSLQILLKKSDILGLKGDCAFANICSQFPYKGLMNNLDQSIIDAELAQFNELINEIKPRFVLVLGRQTARYLFKTSDLEEERGAPFHSYNSIPTILSFHPKEIFRQYEMNIVAQSDFAKMRKIMMSGWEPAKWNINYQPTFQEVLSMLTKFLESKAPLSADIETGSDLRMTCIGLCYNTTSAIVIPFRIPGGRYWNEVEERAVWRLLAKVLETCPLLGQNSVHFDHFVLCIMHKIAPNFIGDTMLAHHEVYCEMPKSLGFINSLYLMNPYWKDVLREARSGKRPYVDEFEYCGKDTIGTLQGAIEIKKEFKELPPKAYEHYKFNIRVSRTFQYMGMNGVLFDTAKCNARIKELDEETKQRELELRVLAGKPNLNVKSPKQMIKWLYEDLKLPPKYIEKKQENGDSEMRETSDYLTLLRLAHEFPDRKELMLAAKLRKVYKRLSTLSTIRVRPDGRVGYAFNIVGTVTGRASAKKPLDKFGIQPQNQDRRDRDLFLGDDQWLKADLEGADAWTVAAMLEAMGDSTMMLDLKTGVKPAQILAIAQCFGSNLITLPAHELLEYKPRLKEIIKQEEVSRGPGKTIYDICKAESHGSNYGMGPQTGVDNIFIRSEGELYITPAQFKQAQLLYEKRYSKLIKLQEKMVSLLNSHGYLDAYSGNRRYFFGRRDNNTVREMLSQLPQAHTTYVTNLLLERLYYWPGNRQSTNRRKFIAAPANQVHDETDIMFKLGDLDQVREIFNKCCKNEIVCWGIKYTIPFEANYGPNWGDAHEEL